MSQPHHHIPKIAITLLVIIIISLCYATDVIPQALKGAGYDLQALISQDIEEHPAEYGIETPDSNIDFRRVNNLDIYFRHHAKSLTTSLQDISEWQGGDIVVFNDHVGIISDQRNRQGVPFLLHHYSPLQTTYEEDILQRYQSDIIGHYRIS